jgi:hypothetical protein
VKLTVRARNLAIVTSIEAPLWNERTVTVIRAIVVAEKGLPSPVATLRGMVGRMGDDIAGSLAIGLGIGQMIARQFSALSP